MFDYWRLPGPSSFLADALYEISSGRNVVMLLPDVEPHGLLDTLRDSLYDRWSVRSLSASERRPPLHAIYDCVLGNVPADCARSTGRLASDERLTGAIVFIEDIPDAEWVAWKQFIEDYEVGCRRLPADRRMLIVLAAKGMPTRDPPVSEVALAVLCWNGRLSEIDMQLYAALRLRGMSVQPRRRQFIATCLARVALWDVAVVDKFCSHNPEAILEPLDVLAQMGAERGWKGVLKPNWQDGSAYHVDGTEQIHSAFLACHQPDSIARRLWSAQASVLLPLIEERRTALLPRVRRYIRFPLTTNAGTVERLEDLEVGHMLWQLNAGGAERSLIRTVERLKRARDALAHLEPLDREMVFHTDLMG